MNLLPAGTRPAVDSCFSRGSAEPVRTDQRPVSGSSTCRARISAEPAADVGRRLLRPRDRCPAAVPFDPDEAGAGGQHVTGHRLTRGRQAAPLGQSGEVPLIATMIGASSASASEARRPAAVPAVGSGRPVSPAGPIFDTDSGPTISVVTQPIRIREQRLLPVAIGRTVPR